ncbi:DUF6415 family natural product biosynthesis protein [Streptomyces sp. NPDC056061]|uniref:DUF6415 family natural product biosynthesis protein n=1 Tax=Streptomyces sp. NPDC056061 TaxID=3345700 RepID=UPI0035DCABB1
MNFRGLSAWPDDGPIGGSIAPSPGSHGHADQLGSAGLLRAVAQATETVARILDEDGPLPETQADRTDLLCRLSGHLMELGPHVPSSGPCAEALKRSWQQAAGAPSVDHYLPLCVHLRALAQRVHELLVEMDKMRSVQGAEAGRLENRNPSNLSGAGTLTVWRQP